MRLDKFLKVSRLIKRRTIANEACESECIYVNGLIKKPGYQLKTGDIIDIVYGKRHTRVEVTDPDKEPYFKELPYCDNQE